MCAAGTHFHNGEMRNCPETVLDAAVVLLLLLRRIDFLGEAFPWMAEHHSKIAVL